MNPIFSKALVIVWRESLEAILIVGIIAAYLQKSLATRQGLKWAYWGIGVGILLSIALGFAMLGVQDELTGNLLDVFQIAMLLLSAALMTQMVFWMGRHSRTLKKEIESDVGKALSKGNLWGILAVSAFAVAREGAEVVVYLYGLSLEGGRGAFPALGASLLAGSALAGITAWSIARGLKLVNLRRVFQFTALWLLLSAGGLLMTATSRLIEKDWLPALLNPIWDTSKFISGDSTVGSLLGLLAGYRPRPALIQVFILALYWGLVILFLNYSKIRGRFRSAPFAVSEGRVS